MDVEAAIVQISNMHKLGLGGGVGNARVAGRDQHVALGLVVPRSYKRHAPAPGINT